MFNCLSEYDHVLLSERIDADEKAIQDLQKQVKDLEKRTKDHALNIINKQLAGITKGKIKELKAENFAANQFGYVYVKASKRLVNSLQDILQDVDPSTLLDLPRDQLIDVILSGGFADSVEDFIEQQDKILEAINASIKIVDPTWNMFLVDQEVEAIKTLTVQNVFDDIVVPTVQKNVRDALLSIVVDTPIDQAMSNLAMSLERGAGTLQTEIRTKISQFGRSVNMIAADAVGIDQYLYTGPKDGITRPFCRALINKVVSKEQMDKLNNGQGLSVQSSGGGYNCRHSWSPVTSAFVDAAGLNKATSSDISKANSGAKKK